MRPVTGLSSGHDQPVPGIQALPDVPKVLDSPGVLLLGTSTPLRALQGCFLLDRQEVDVPSMFTGFIVNHRGKSTRLVFEVIFKTFPNTSPCPTPGEREES